jgi:hypothetical protein
MTTNQAHTELAESKAKIRRAEELLKTVRARHTDHKALLADALRTAKMLKGGL